MKFTALYKLIVILLVSSLFILISACEDENDKQSKESQQGENNQHVNKDQQVEYSQNDVIFPEKAYRGSEKSLKHIIHIQETYEDKVELIGQFTTLVKPLIPIKDEHKTIALEPGKTLGQDFLVPDNFNAVIVNTPAKEGAGYTVVLYRDGPSGEKLHEATLKNVTNGENKIETPKELGAGRYYVELKNPVGEVGWITQPLNYQLGAAYEGDQLLLDVERVMSIGTKQPVSVGQIFRATNDFNEIIVPMLSEELTTTMEVKLYNKPDRGQLLAKTRLMHEGKNARAIFGKMPSGKYYIEFTNLGEDVFHFGIAKNKDEAVNQLYLNGLPQDGRILAMSFTYDTANSEPHWDTYSDTWVAVDGLGRSLPTSDQVGPPRKDKFIGMFYWTWMHRQWPHGPYDVSKILAKYPDAMKDKDHPAWGPMGHPHHWGESIFGYYLSDDKYVISKHAQMLSDAGVDVIFFDVTNQVTFKEYYMTLFEVYTTIRSAGGKTPQVAFLTPFWEPAKVVNELYQDLYGLGLYEDLWFKWDGKPLILADPDKVSADYRSVFTFRKPEPSYFKGPSGPDQWSWLEVFPQHVFYDEEGNAEQMSVGVAQNAVDGRLATLSQKGAHGRSYHNGKMPEEPYPTAYGYNFKEQFERALEVDPEIIFITGWNEWIAGRFDEFVGVKEPVMFVDQFNQEFSRDLEPMKGGHGDSYYYQLIDYVRKFKGAREIPKAGPEKTISVDGSFNEWLSVTPTYRDTLLDTLHRDHPGFGTGETGPYINTTGRNDIVEAKVSRDKKNLYFYVRTYDPITSYTDKNWMWLLLNAGGDYATGWHGYDYLINHEVLSETKTTIKKTSSGWNWEKAGEIDYRVNGNELQLAIPLKLLGLKGKSSFTIDFKWADNVQKEDDIMEFIVSGDAAPNDRYNYRYRVE
jgi:hypothetical protein